MQVVVADSAVVAVFVVLAVAELAVVASVAAVAVEEPSVRLAASSEASSAVFVGVLEVVRLVEAGVPGDYRYFA